MAVRRRVSGSSEGKVHPDFEVGAPGEPHLRPQSDPLSPMSKNNAESHYFITEEHISGRYSSQP